jgi:hypothetical protein
MSILFKVFYYLSIIGMAEYKEEVKDYTKKVTTSFEIEPYIYDYNH